MGHSVENFLWKWDNQFCFSITTTIGNEILEKSTTPAAADPTPEPAPATDPTPVPAPATDPTPVPAPAIDPTHVPAYTFKCKVYIVLKITSFLMHILISDIVRWIKWFFRLKVCLVF